MIIYQERQKFNQWWLWAIVLTALAVVIVATYAAVSEGQTWLILFPTLVGVGVMAMLAALNLKTTITEDTIRTEFFGLGQTIHREEVTEAYVRQYSPVGEYGGWGYRLGMTGSGKAYNVMGDQGLQLVLTNGKKLLIGTQRPEELHQVIQSWMGEDADTLDLSAERQKSKLRNLL